MTPEDSRTKHIVISLFHTWFYFRTFDPGKRNSHLEATPLKFHEEATNLKFVRVQNG